MLAIPRCRSGMVLFFTLTLSLSLANVAEARQQEKSKTGIENSGSSQLVQTPDGIFTTRIDPVTLPMPIDEDAFQFIIYGDRTGGVPEGLKFLRRAVVDTNLLDPDFVLTVGDLIQGYNRPPLWMREMREFRDIMGELNMPWFPVAGNHDIYWDFRDANRPRQHHEANYEEHFGPLWYSFEHKGSGFIILFSDEGDPTTGEKGFNEGRLQMVSDEQMEFLAQSLSRFKDRQHVFVALHHPRWIGGGYQGSNWPRVHKLLVDAGNVSGVFAGHIHQMRYDPKDGIEYFALATTGGNLGADLPEAGFLHHFNVVTVRDDSVTVATLPVGEVMDPKKFKPEFHKDVNLVRQMRPRPAANPLGMHLDGSVAQHYSVAIPNPGKFPIEVAITPQSTSGWRVVPDHQHIVIPPGKTDGMDFYFYRGLETADSNDDRNIPADLWAGFQTPSLEMTVDYLHASARIRFPAVQVPVGVILAGVADGKFEKDLLNCLALSGKQSAETRRVNANIMSDCARINSQDFVLPNGPFTLEAWVNPAAIDDSRAVVAKTESSEFAIFLHNGIPQFDVHLNGRYVTPKGDKALPLNQWVHLAGVYDGEQVRLFVDGELVSSMAGNGQRKLNNLPLYIGADPDGYGNPCREFAGHLDEIRLSSSVRYTESFTPSKRFVNDDDTVFLLHLDQSAGPFLYDDSTPPVNTIKFGNATIQPVSGDR